jgi:hypothetical protein
MTIKKVIRLENDMVLVFDESGEQLPDYQGMYRDVRERLLQSAPADAVFCYWHEFMAEPLEIIREEW